MRVPDVYTHGHEDTVLRSHRWRPAENSAGYLLPHLVSGQRLLDVGCGPGTITVTSRLLGRMELLAMDDSILREAGRLNLPGTCVNSSDAIYLVTA